MINIKISISYLKDGILSLKKLWSIMMAEYKRKDHLHQKAKDEGYRSRAAYKLVEIQKRFKLLRKGATVLDLGCWPGGWLQVAAKEVGPQGLVIGIDLVETDKLPDQQVVLIKGDIESDEMQEKINQASKGSIDVIISDMSAKLTGIRDQDEMGSLRCGMLALNTAKKFLKSDGSLVMKLFPGNEIESFLKSQVKPLFSQISRTELDSSRSSSKEFYVIAKSYKS